MKTVGVWLLCSTLALAQPAVTRTTVQISLSTTPHSDQVYYLAGETIAAQAQIFDALTHKLDSLDDPLYIDCLEMSKGRLIKRLMIQPKQGTARFTLSLPDSLHTGYYQLRAYTNWMRNFPVDAFGRTTVLILSSTYMQEAPVQSAIPRVDSVALQSEGGSLVGKLRNNLIIYSQDKFGTGTAVEGLIITNRHDTISTFQTDKQGLTSIEIIPQDTLLYWLQVGNKRINLSPAQTQGSVLRCDNIPYPDKIRVTVQNRYEQPGDTLTFVAQNRGRTVFYTNLPAQSLTTVFYIPITQFEEGITNFILFDKQKKPICERMIYIPSRAKPTTTTWLNSELNKPIPDLLTSRQINQALVLRRNTLFSWPELNRTRPYLFAHEQGIHLAGRVARWNNKPVSEPVPVSFLAIPRGDDSLSQRELLFTSSDNQGRFVFQNLVLYGTYDGVLTAKIGNLAAQISVDSVDIPPIAAESNPIDWRLLGEQRPVLLARNDSLLKKRQRSISLTGITLQTVTVTGQTAPGQQPIFTNKPSARLDKSRVMSGGVGGGIGPVFRQYIAYRLAKYSGSHPITKIFVDDREILSTEELAMINVGIIDHIDVHDGDPDAYRYGVSLIVAIYTTYGTSLLTKSSLGKHISVVGFQREKTTR